MFLITNLYRVSLLFSPFSRMKIDYLSPVCCKISERSVGTDMPGMHIVAPSLLHSMLTYIYIYTYISAQPVKKPSNQIRAIFLPILSIRSRTFYSCAAGVLHDHHYLLQASRNVQHRIDGWPGMGAALEEHPVQQVQGLSSSKQKRALSQVGTTFGKVSGGKRRWKRRKQAFLSSFVQLFVFFKN